MSKTKFLSVIKNNYKDAELKLALNLLASKKQNGNFLNLLYYMLEEDTPLFFELFGGEILKIPTKNEFLKATSCVKVFLSLLENKNKSNPLAEISEQLKIEEDKVIAKFKYFYKIIIENKNKQEIDYQLSDEDISFLKKIYLENTEKDNQDEILNNGNDSKQLLFKDIISSDV